MDQKKIGAFIAEMRKARQLTQHDLADIIGISDKTVSRWETGRGMPEVSLIIPLCNELGITATELLSGNRAIALNASGLQDARRHVRTVQLKKVRSLLYSP